jgi:hypothetical protein
MDLPSMWREVIYQAYRLLDQVTAAALNHPYFTFALIVIPFLIWRILKEK